MKTTIAIATALTLLVACDENPETPPLGDLAVATASPAVQAGTTTTDGWRVTYTQFLVHVSAVNVAGADGVLTASAEAQLFDLVPPDPQILVESTNRIARAWEDVNLEIGPATTESALMGAVSEADRANMASNGYSVFIQATMSRGTETKTLKLGFATDTKYEHCSSNVNGATTPGLTVPSGSLVTTSVGFTGDVLFFDNLVTRGHVLRGDPIAAADANNDGLITNDELADVDLDEDFRKTTQGLYEALPGVEDLNGYLTEQARSILATYRDDTGSCVTTPATESP